MLRTVNPFGKTGQAKHLDPNRLMFSVFTANDIKSLSVLKICTPLSFNVLGHPLKGGLYDPALGPLNDHSDPCGTCGEGPLYCSGHFGHIDLPVPVVNPLFHKVLCTLLKLSCLKCYTLQIPSYIKLLLNGKLRLMEEGFLNEVQGLEQEVHSAVANMNQVTEAELEFISDIIETYIETIRNQKRYLQSNKTEGSFSARVLNMEWHSYIESVLKNYKAGRMCINCHNPIPRMTVLKNKILINQPALNDDTMMANRVIHRLETTYVMPDQSKKNLRGLWEQEADILKIIIPCLGLVDLEWPTDIFFFEVIPVLPPIVRPVNILNSQLVEHPQTQVYKSIIQDCLVLRNIIQTIQDGDTHQLPEEGRAVFEGIRGESAAEKLHHAWTSLQSNVDHLMDRELSKTTESANCQGLKQVIEKKEGIIRMHMMGKRVNYAARSVITPDPNLNIDEIGVPEAFALKLTYPVPVTPWNVTELRKLIMNGPEVHPGAVMIEGEDGFVKHLRGDDKTQLEAIAKRLLTSSSRKTFNGIKIVHRHLQNGDMLLLNRQPTLHKPSIMAHKARILKGEKTLRLHYANCKAYNADFDGDEMNTHFPQNELARSEGYFIANVSNQYLVPKDGTPLGGLIQDHVISGVRLTLRGNFFNREDYMQLVYSAIADKTGELVLLPPSILKPARLWSGKQIISTVILNLTPRGRAPINLEASAKIAPKDWQVRKARRWKCGEEFTDQRTMSEAEVVIRGGELLSGVLDKTHYGATPYGLIHCLFELYGGTCSSKVLSAFGKLFQTYLQISGFTLGVEDILVVRKSDQKRRDIIETCRQIGDQIQSSTLELDPDSSEEQLKSKMEESYAKDPKFRAVVDRKYKSALDVFTNDINKTCLPAGLLKKFPHNNLQLMVQSGAKGSTVNTMQISCLLGQIELEGKRPPLMISGKSLPSFPAYDSSPRSGGFIDGRFMTGIQPQEFFFHCMAGREGLIDTAVKTSRSGYLQRCLIKHLEGLTVNYDSTVRDSDGSLIQMCYGEDGLDIPNSRFLRKEEMDFLVDNRKAIVDPALVEHLKDETTEKIRKLNKKIRKWRAKHGDTWTKWRTSGFAKFSVLNNNPASSKHRQISSNCGRSKAALSLMKKWIKADEEVKKRLKDECARCPDPASSVYRQDLQFGVLTEKMEALMEEYLNEKSRRFTTSIGKEEVRDLLCTKIMKSLCPPGEPVGLLAAQSIGEPSTQMTLNTFHFAGRGEMNVTLGIPRLREILMMASKNIKTPSMEIPFKKHLPNVENQSKKMQLKLTKCYLSNVLRNIKLERKLEENPQRQLTFTVTVNCLPHRSYKHEYCVKPRNILEQIERSFFKLFFQSIKKLGKSTGTLLHIEEEKSTSRDDDAMLDIGEPDEPDTKPSRSDLGELHESSDEEQAAEDADATASRSISRHRENQEYEDPEEEEMEDAAPREPEDDEKHQIPNDTPEDEDDPDEPICIADKLITEQRKKDVANMYTYALDYDFDSEKFLWCKLKFWLPLQMSKLDLPTILRTVAEKVVLWETPAIKRAFTFQNPEGETVLKTDGLNIVEMFKYAEILDLHKLYTNDIYGVSQTYGIEAANRVILKEVKDVFRMYGITVDTRHLSLIADYMTFDGTFQPLSRKGMEDSASPLQQMSFESSLNFLKNATLQGKQDNLMSPSSRLMLGQPCKTGTGAFNVFLKINNTALMT
ncbi:DNA-directed RNA polymerase I subunit RPA1 [Venturia canescens]|uniref:DNA-directed RNA polymerase I subunit RPA1 n=1 Tax=Venturia canescens TaxID=32260 RepID=UPI001C9C9F2A|nr:DNA-directed RNA polymerase I subunit RPA1 [Venturia canescens]